MPNKTLTFVMSLVIGSLFLSAGVKAQTAEPAPSSESVDVQAAEAAAKEALNNELATPTLTDKTAVDFPNRQNLGTQELAVLPGINETDMTGPSPMAISVSKKDLPSEQLIGKITPEVFQEMADIERASTFLRLQKQKEELKNDLERTRAMYRQSRLEEIAKREEVVKERIKWWQEQEELREELRQKKAETENIEQRIEEEKALREELRKKALQRRETAETKGTTEEVTEEVGFVPTTYVLMGVRGMSDTLMAQLQDADTQAVITVKKNDVLPSGYVVSEITKDYVIISYGDLQTRVGFNQ